MATVKARVRLRGTKTGYSSDAVLADSGARMSLIDFSLAERIGVEYTGRGINFVSISGKEGGGMGSISVEEKEYNFIEELCRMEGKKATNMLRELIGLGRTMLAVKRYQEGKVSLGKAAKIAGITLN